MKPRFASLMSLMVPLVVSAAPLVAQPPLPPPPDLEALLRKANGNGKYAMLLKQVFAPEDQATWGPFNDRGLHAEGEVNKVAIPAGYRVYAAPYWYIWRDQRMEKRAWGPEQLIGEPDTREAGDIQTAWASKTQDDEDEWILLEYDVPVVATTVTVHETHNPGAVRKITAFTMEGQEENVWAGQDTPQPGVIFINQKNFPRPFKTNRIKLYLDSKNVPGWNEIDAVGLTDKAGKTHWAANAECSSTYTDKAAKALGIMDAAGQQADLLRMLAELRQLQADINELRRKAGLPPRELAPLPDPAPDVVLFLGDDLIEEGALDVEPRLVEPPVIRK